MLGRVYQSRGCTPEYPTPKGGKAEEVAAEATCAAAAAVDVEMAAAEDSAAKGDVEEDDSKSLAALVPFAPPTPAGGHGGDGGDILCSVCKLPVEPADMTKMGRGNSVVMHKKCRPLTFFIRASWHNLLERLYSRGLGDSLSRGVVGNWFVSGP